MGYLIQRQIRQNLRTHWDKITTGDHTQLMVLYTLADHADEGDAAKGATPDRPGGTRTCFPSIDKITNQGVASRRQVMRALAELRTKGYVTSRKHPHHSTNEFHVTDMVAGKAQLEAALAGATAMLTSTLGITPLVAADRLDTMVRAWEHAYAESHDDCSPTPQVLAAAVNDIAAALIATGHTIPLTVSLPDITAPDLRTPLLRALPPLEASA